MRKLSIVFVIYVILLVSSVNVNSQCNMKGRVLNHAGVPQRLAQVRYEGPATYVMLTNRNGEYCLPESPEVGKYQVTVKLGIRYQRFIVTIGNGINPETLIVNWQNRE